MGKNLPAKQEMWVQSLGQEDPMEKEMATHFSTLAWEIPETEEPSGLGLVGHDLATEQHYHSYTIYIIQTPIINMC